MASKSRAPKARTCYICGRPTLLPGYDNHIVQCRKLFEQRESLKPKNERRPCPRDPYENSSMGSGNWNQGQLDEMNEMANQQWKSSLAQCQNCGRSFLPEKLVIHQRSCTSANPARGVGGTQAMKANSYDNSYEDNNNLPLKSGKFNGTTSSSSSKGIGYGADYTNNGGTGGGGDNYRETPDYGHLIKCNECGRNFNPDSYEKHARICRKVFQSKRKVFDSTKARMKGTELAAYYDGMKRSNKRATAGGGGGGGGSGSRTSSSLASSTTMTRPSSGRRPQPGGGMGGSMGGGGGGGGGSAGGLPKWKAESLQFREAMRQARMVSRAEQQSKQTGIPLHQLLPPTGAGGGSSRAGRGGGGGARRAGGGGGRNTSNYDNNDYGYETNSYQQAPINPGYIQCPHCGRSYNQKAGERHIPQCANIMNKPSRLSRGSGVPSYSTLSSSTAFSPNTTNNSNISPPSATTSSFGASSRASAMNNTAIRRNLDAGARGGGGGFGGGSGGGGFGEGGFGGGDMMGGGGGGGMGGGGSNSRGMDQAVKMNSSAWGGGGSGGGGFGGGGGRR